LSYGSACEYSNWVMFNRKDKSCVSKQRFADPHLIPNGCQDISDFFRLDDHDDGGPQIKIAEFFASLQLVLFCDVDPHDVECSDHDHGHQALLPLAGDCDPSILFVDGFALGDGLLGDAVATAVNGQPLDDFHVDWGVEAVVVSGSQVNHQLEQLIVFVQCERVFDVAGVVLLVYPAN